jgi:hypothetical protein
VIPDLGPGGLGLRHGRAPRRSWRQSWAAYRRRHRGGPPTALYNAVVSALVLQALYLATSQPSHDVALLKLASALILPFAFLGAIAMWLWRARGCVRERSAPGAARRLLRWGWAPAIVSGAVVLWAVGDLDLARFRLSEAELTEHAQAMVEKHREGEVLVSGYLADPVTIGWLRFDSITVRPVCAEGAGCSAGARTVWYENSVGLIFFGYHAYVYSPLATPSGAWDSVSEECRRLTDAWWSCTGAD